MTAIIHCSATFEDPAYFAAPITPTGAIYSIAVSLGFDWREIDGEPSPEKGKEWFMGFLDDLRRFSFRLYYPDQTAGADPTIVLKPMSGEGTDFTVEVLGEPAGDDLVAFKKWLEERALDQWITDQPPPDGASDVNAINAAGLVNSATTWAAPIPVELALVRILRVRIYKVPLLHIPFVVIPFIPGQADQELPVLPQHETNEKGAYEFQYDAGSIFNQVIGVVNSLDPADTHPTGLIDSQTGYLIPSSDADKIYHVVKKIEDRSGSLLWSFQPLATIDWKEGAKSDVAESLRLLVWRGLNGLATLLDPLIISLRMDGGLQEGPFLSALASCIEGRVPDARSAEVPTFVRQRLSLYLGAPPSENGEDPRERGELANHLADLFGLDLRAETPDLLTHLLNIYVKIPPGQLPDDGPEMEALQKQFTQLLELTLNRELQSVAQKVQSEAGIEDLALKLLTAIGVDATKLKELCVEGSVKDYEGALADFQAFLNGSFNGFDAARSAQAGVYRDLLIAWSRQLIGGGTTNHILRWSFDNLVDSLKQAKWFVRRLTAASGGAFEKLVLNLPVYAQAALRESELSFLNSKSLSKDFDNACKELLANPKVGRFVPDHGPQPLPVQIAVDTDIQAGDQFSRLYNGVSLVVRRNDSSWAHANLAMLKVPRGEDAYFTWGPTLLPLQPVAVDGQHRLFVEYDGVPLASDAFVHTHVPQDAHPQDSSSPFFTKTDPTKTELGPQAPLPALYYGANYDIAGFLVSKGGSAPKGVQRSDDKPWMLANSITVPEGKQPLYKTFPYRRTTAIGRVAIVEPNTSRIGAHIPGVQALARDFPRIGFGALEGEGAVQDLLRNTDGSGAFTLPRNGASSTIELIDLWWWTGPGKLGISVFGTDSVNPEDSADVELEFKFATTFAGKALRIEIVGIGNPGDSDRKLIFTPSFDNVQGAPKEVMAGKSLLNAESVWIRVRIDAGDKGVSLSLADPSAALRTQHTASRGGADGLLLIAPTSDGSEWQPQFTELVRAVVAFPKMGMLDFDRWFSNPSLMVDAWGKVTDGSTAGDFLELLMSYYIGRHQSNSLAALLDTLPDLAVDQLLIELTPLDSLASLPADAVSYPRVVNKLIRVINLSKLGHRWNGLKQTDLKVRLARLAINHSAELVVQGSEDRLEVEPIIQAADATQEWKIKVTIPRGMVARLSVRPMVRKDFVNDIFVDRMRSLASELRGDHYVFEGAAMTIECMLGALAVIEESSERIPDWQDAIAVTDDAERCAEIEELVAESVIVEWAASQRGYDLVGKGPSPQGNADAAWRWRRFGSVDVHTQRWRFMGRPIYSWFEPKRHFKPTTPEQLKLGVLPAQNVVVPLDNSREVMDFEAEIFNDRDGDDLDTRTMQLNPGSTVLQAVPWESASSTWFRHRITVRSRYAGALGSNRKQRVEVRGWGDDTIRGAPGWIRVAVLGDRTRLQLTRPQLRALMPLTMAPRIDSQAVPYATPPVLAVLDERPFTHGGLADRIGAEIKTSLGYKFNRILTIEDSRKEFGPDPRLSYRSTSQELALAVTLQVEGPVGLTFDSDSIRTPVFGSSALTLQPLILSDKKIAPTALEEHFLSVVLRRYLDPRWLPDAPEIKPTRSGDRVLPLNMSWWLESSSPQQYRYDGEGNNIPLCTIEVSDNRWVVKVGKRYLDVTSKESDDLVLFCEMAEDVVSHIALLHIPLESGRASLSIFAYPLPDADAEKGKSTIPLMMASVDVILRTASHLMLRGDVVASATSASPVTSMNWTRTGKHFDILHAGRPDSSPLQPYVVGGLVVRSQKGNYIFVNADDEKDSSLAFEPTSGRYPNPLYLHRHHALIVTKVTEGPGEKIEVFVEIFRIFGQEFSLQAGMRAVRLVEFETPAVPLSYAVSGPTMFESAHFDLLSIGRTVRRPLIGCSFFLRLLGDGAVKSFDSVTLGLAIFYPKSKHQFTLTLVRTAMTRPDPPLRGISITLKIHPGTLPEVEAQAVFCGGAVWKLDTKVAARGGKINPLPAELGPIAIEVSIDAISGITGELWGDISMLSLPESGSFSFDWLFTGEVTSTLPPSAAVTGVQLEGLFEAEARVISVSPPIRVES